MTDLKKYQFKLPDTGVPATGALPGWGNRTSAAAMHATVAPVSSELPADAAGCLAKGNTWLQGGRIEDALRAYDRAIALQPDYLEPHFNRGNVLLRLQRLPEALAAFERAIALSPELAIAHYNRATILGTTGRADEALAGYQRTLALDSTMVQARFNLGTLYLQKGDAEQALACMDQVIAQAPNVVQAHLNRGNALLKLNRVADAGRSFDRALALQAQSPEALSNRANARLQLKNYEAALADLSEAVRLNPKQAQTRQLLGTLLRDTGDPEKALAEFQEAYALAPELPGVLSDLVATAASVCDWPQLSSGIARVEEAIRAGRGRIAPMVAVGLLDSPELQLACARQTVARDHPADAALGPLVRRPSSGKIRVGYFSADFHDQALGQQLADLLERHDRAQFEWIAFSYGPNTQDTTRGRLRQAFHQFHDVQERSDREVAALARELGVDVAVDLKGLAPGGRLGIFAHRVAPVQMGYLGYPGTTGADYIDYLIADKRVLPTGEPAHFSEKVVSLPLCRQVAPQAKAENAALTRAEVGLPADSVVFCCFSPAFRILPATFDGWLRILQAAPGSVLWLQDDNPAATRHLCERAQAQGVDPARLVFAERGAQHAPGARYPLADLALDTLPFNDASQTGAALAAGVPVLTQTGAAFAGRVGASLLHGAGLPELVTATSADYEACAIQLARDPAQLRQLRERLLAQRASAPLFNAKRLARSLEAAYVAVDERQLQGLPPKAIEIRT